MIQRIFLILAFAMFAATLGEGIIGPLLPLYAQNMGASGIWLGAIFSGFAVSRMIIMPFVGRLSDRRGRKQFLVIGLFFSAVISLGYLWANDPAHLTLVRLFHGAASGMIIPIAQTCIGDVSPEGEEGKWMGYTQTAFFSGFGFGPFLGGIVSDHFGMNTAFLSMTGLTVLSFAIVVLFLPEVRQRKMGSGPRPSFRQMGNSDVVKALFSFRMMHALGRASSMAFLPILAATNLNLSQTLIGILLSFQFTLLSVLGIPGGKLADRISRRTLVLGGGFINLVGLGLMPFAGSFWYLMGLTFVQGLGGGLAVPSASALTVSQGRRFGMGSTFGIFMVAMGIGTTVGPILSGAVADYAGINFVFYLAAILMFVGTALFAWFMRHQSLENGIALSS